MRTDKYQKGCDVKVTCVDPCHRVFDIVLAQIESRIFDELINIRRWFTICSYCAYAATNLSVSSMA